jgi:hypothetical protein
MNSKKPVANCPTAWSVNVLGASLMPKVLTAKEKMLLTSRLYLKVEATPTAYGSKAQLKTDRLKEMLLAL